MQIKNSVAVVTGATGGIGLAIVRALVDKGAKAVALVDRSDRCTTISEQINDALGTDVALPFQGDVTDQRFRETVFCEMADRYQCVQICIPAAGILRDAMAVKLNPDSGKAELYPEPLFRQVLDVNLTHPTYWAMQLIAGMAEHRARRGLGQWQSDEPIQGSIVLIGSVSSRGNRGQVSYAATKSGLNAVASTLNVEGLYHGVQVKIIHPGLVDTAMVESIPDHYFESRLKPLVGLGRLIQPQEIAQAVLTLIENPVISGPLWADASLRSLI